MTLQVTVRPKPLEDVLDHGLGEQKVLPQPRLVLVHFLHHSSAEQDSTMQLNARFNTVQNNAAKTALASAAAPGTRPCPASQQRRTKQNSTLQYSTVRYGMVRYSTTQYDSVKRNKYCPGLRVLVVMTLRRTQYR